MNNLSKNIKETGPNNIEVYLLRTSRLKQQKQMMTMILMHGAALPLTGPGRGRETRTGYKQYQVVLPLAKEAGISSLIRQARQNQTVSFPYRHETVPRYVLSLKHQRGHDGQRHASQQTPTVVLPAPRGVLPA